MMIMNNLLVGGSAIVAIGLLMSRLDSYNRRSLARNANKAMGDWRVFLALVILVVISISGCASTKSVSDQIKDAGLEIEGIRTLQQSELPPGAIEGQQFKIPACESDCGGKILIFSKNIDAERMADIWRDMGQWVYVSGGTLLQINGSLDQAVADQYGAVVLD